MLHFQGFTREISKCFRKKKKKWSVGDESSRIGMGDRTFARRCENLASTSRDTAVEPKKANEDFAAEVFAGNPGDGK